ncbi:MAG TPA: ATP-binding protein [Bryobacteraceae bacterium]|jgi:PAS domain S-box-containing protein|nr:ATP-binding protein [Bryobacteraceae bacterium]
MPHTPKANSVRQSLPANGEMAELIGTLDWSSTPIGAPENWPLALRTMAPILLANRFPQLLWWGPEYICIYNDAYIPILGNKHPWGLGRPVCECWSEVWDVLRPLIDRPFHGGPATWIEDFELPLNRLGFMEETHFTVAYSAVPDEAAPGGIGGVLATVHEITEKVFGQRRVAILRDLGTGATGAKTVDEACATAAATLKPHTKDIPFAILYVIDASGTHARLAASCGIDERGNMRPALIPLDNSDDQNAAWPLADARRTGRMRLVEDLPSRFVDIPPGPWSDPPRRAAIVPIRSHIANQLSGFLVAGVSARIQFNEAYRNFLNLAATQIAAAISNAQSYQEERKRAEALAEIDRAKTAFFSNVSHEFRTPLTLMLGPLDDALANSHGVLPMGAAASLAVAHRNALRLLKLVNTMLDFSRIEAGRAQACYQPVDLAALTEELASNFQSLCDKAGLRLTVHCAHGEPVYVDRDMWEKIVLNLLSNAFKFTFRGGIEVRLEGTEGQAVLSVRDTGVGIPDRELPHMFERFHRIEHNGIDHHKGRTHEGTGIGLALVQELAKLHGGTVSVESKEGEGSTFRVAIPRGKAHLDPERIGDSSPVDSTPAMPAAFIEEAMRWLPDEILPDGTLPNDAFGESRRTGLSEGGAEQKHGKSRILWADDNADMRAYVSRLLRERFNVEAVPDGNAALIAARMHKPDLILTDVMMPGLDGFGLLRELRADPQLGDIPVILLSARAGEEARIEGMQAGADDYLTKPFSARQLLGLVESHLKMSAFRREMAEAAKRAERNASLLASIVESSDDAIISKDLDGTIMSWNQGAERLFGYNADEVVGQSITLLIPPDRLDEEPEILARLRRGERVEHFETIRVRRDGVLLNISLTISPIRDAQGRIVGASKTARDITEHVRQQQALKEANAALRQANSDLQQFAYSASHDLQEPLRMVRAYSELLQRRFGGQLGQDGDEFIRHTVDGAIRMDNLLRDLRTYIRISAADRKSGEETDAGEVLNKALANLQSVIDASGASIHAAPLPRVRMLEFELQQVFQNLIVNAIRYRASEPPDIHISATPRDGAWLFSVQDNGIGIEPQFRDQIFGIFKRLHTNTAYPGTGIGLAICQRIFERAGGRIWVESESGKGSTFYFTIPAASDGNVQAA